MLIYCFVDFLINMSASADVLAMAKVEIDLNAGAVASTRQVCDHRVALKLHRVRAASAVAAGASPVLRTFGATRGHAEDAAKDIALFDVQIVTKYGAAVAKVRA